MSRTPWHMSAPDNFPSRLSTSSFSGSAKKAHCAEQRGIWAQRFRTNSLPKISTVSSTAYACPEMRPTVACGGRAQGASQ